MQYYNFLTTPSGIYCKLFEITNKDYLILCKFAESQNKVGFFEVLDTHIKSSIPNFDQFNLIDKIYVYIAFALYSIKGSISVKSNIIASQQVSLLTILNNIEERYQEFKPYTVNVSDKLKLNLFLPLSFEIDSDQNISVDFLSSCYSLQKQGEKEMMLTDEMKQQLIPVLSEQTKMMINEQGEQKCSVIVDLFKGTPFNEYKTILCSSYMLDTVIEILAEPLESFYTKQFAVIKYAKISYDGYMQMTPLESQIMINQLEKEAEEKEKISKGERG